MTRILPIENEIPSPSVENIRAIRVIRGCLGVLAAIQIESVLLFTIQFFPSFCKSTALACGLLTVLTHCRTPVGFLVAWEDDANC